MLGAPETPARGRVSLRDIALTFARVGAFGFGGGVGMLALIRQTVVERKRWVNDEQLSTAVAMGQMLPGPFVSNYAEYIGYELRGWPGMTVAVVALLLPCFVLMCGLSVLYFRFGSVPLVMRLFAGVQPVVVGILAWATWSIGRSNIRNWPAVVIGAIAAIALFFKADVLLVVLGCGVLGIVFSGAWRKADKDSDGNGTGRLVGVVPPFWLLGTAAGAALPFTLSRAGELAFVFLKVGTVIFGGGFAAIPFLQHEVVDLRHWLTMREFIDGVALGQITPGPVAITAAFIGYKVLGLPGALIASLGTFLPSTFMLIGLVHIYRRIKDHVLVRGFLSGVMPAVTGMLLTATVFIGRSAITGPVPAVMAPLALALLIRYRLDPVWLILGGALAGLALP
jgi:chromate transporter